MRARGTRRPALRQVLNGIWYLLKTGCQWRMLPREFGKWNTVYAYFKAWRRAGVWARPMDVLRQRERGRQERAAEPWAGSVDSQSIKTATQATEVGFDGGNQGQDQENVVPSHTSGHRLSRMRSCTTGRLHAPY